MSDSNCFEEGQLILASPANIADLTAERDGQRKSGIPFWETSRFEMHHGVMTTMGLDKKRLGT
jgi:hypothetical protein